MSENQKLTDLEIRIAYLEDTLDTLDSVLTRRSEELARLEDSQVAMLKKMENLEELLANLDRQAGEEPPPPHY